MPDRKKDQNDELENEFFNSGEGSNIDQIDIPANFKPSWAGRWRRNPYISVAVVPLSVILIYLLFPDFIYGVRGIFNPKPQNLGDISKALSEGKLKNNTWVEISGRPWIQSLLPVPKGGRMFRPRTNVTPSSYYLYFLLQDTDNRVVVKMNSSKPQFIGDIPKKFKGRVRRINEVKEGYRIKSYYKNNIKGIDIDILFNKLPLNRAIEPKAFQEAYEKNKIALGKGKNFVTDSGQNINPMPDFKMDVIFSFPQDYVISFNRKKEISAEMEVITGTYTAKTCNGQTGGDVIFMKTTEVDFIPEHAQVKGNSYKEPVTENKVEAKTPAKTVVNDKTKATEKQVEPAKPAVIPPVIVKIPMDAAVAEVKSNQVIPFDKNGQIVFRGKPCNEKATSIPVKVQRTPFASLDGCMKWLSGKKYPFVVPDEVMTGKTDSIDGDFEIIARLPASDAEEIDKKSAPQKVCDKSKKGPDSCIMIYPDMSIRPRTAFIGGIEMRNISLQGDSVMISGVRTDFPKFYKSANRSLKIFGDRKTASDVEILEPNRLETVYSFPVTSLRKFKYYPPVELNSSTYVIDENDKPRSLGILWKIPVVFILLLLGFFNLKVVIFHFALKR